MALIVAAILLSPSQKALTLHTKGERQCLGLKSEEDMATDLSLLHEQAYLVARGVRPLAVIGQCESEQLQMLRVATLVERYAEPGVIPFVIDRNDGYADYGFAAASWVIDLYEHIARAQIIPPDSHRIVGLLLGYSVDAIARFEDEGTGRRWRSDG